MDVYGTSPPANTQKSLWKSRLKKKVRTRGGNYYKEIRKYCFPETTGQMLSQHCDGKHKSAEIQAWKEEKIRKKKSYPQIARY